MANSRTRFTNMLMPAAIREGRRIGVDPRIIVAQAAQETGWGRAAPGNNYFGIKSHGKSGGQTFATHEVINGKRVSINDSFRRFASPDESVKGYADFLSSNKRYRPMLQAKGIDAQIQALGASGYATDPNYASSISRIAKGIPMMGGTPIAATPAGKAVTDLAVGQSTMLPTPQQKPAMPETSQMNVSPFNPPTQEQFPPAPGRKIFGLSTTPPAPGSRSLAIAQALGAFGTGLAAGNPAAGLQGAADVAKGFTQGQANVQSAQGLGFTPQQMGVLSNLPPEAQQQVLSSQAFGKPEGLTDLQRNIGMLPESDREKALRIHMGMDPRAENMAATVPSSYKEWQLATQDPTNPYKGSYADWAKGTPEQSKPTAEVQQYEYGIQQLRDRGVPEDKLPTFQEWSKPKSRGISFTGPDGTKIQIGGDGETASLDGTSIPAEVGGRIGLGQSFLKEDYPEIMEIINKGDATGLVDWATGKAGRGDSGKVQRRVASGVDALRRGLTGAGMAASEAEEYASRYSPQLMDDSETLRLKVEGLKRDLEAVSSGAVMGKAGNISGLLPTLTAPTPGPEAGAEPSIEDLLKKY